MLEYIEILESFPEELREPMLKLIGSVEDRILSRLEVTKGDFLSLRDAIKELAEAQRKSEERITKLEAAVERLEEAIEKLAEAQRRTEERVDRLEKAVEELAEAQRKSEERITKLEAAVERLEEAIEKLTEAQRRTEERIDRLEKVVERLAEAQRRTEERVDKLAEIDRSIEIKIGALGARWGIGSETAFRNAIRGILEEVGFHVERYLKFDEEGMVFGRPDQVELDIVMRDKKVFLIEIKSSVSRGDVSIFERKARFYQEKEDKTVDRKIIISPFLDPGAEDMARGFGIEVFTDANQVG